MLQWVNLHSIKWINVEPQYNKKGLIREGFNSDDFPLYFACDTIIKIWSASTCVSWTMDFTWTPALSLEMTSDVFSRPKLWKCTQVRDNITAKESKSKAIDMNSVEMEDSS